MSAACSAVTDEINSALGKFPSFQGSIVYRGQSSQKTRLLDPTVPFESAQFLSTSISNTAASNFGDGALLVIRTAKAGSGKHIVNYSADGTSEDEVLFPPHTRFRVCGISTESGKTVIRMSEITDHDEGICGP